MVRLPCILTAALCAASCAATQEPKRAELSVEQELAALIEKTNALETFHVVYDVERSMKGGPKGSIELIYRAPDLGHLHIASPEGGAEFWIVGKHMYTQADAQLEGRWRQVTLPEPSQASKILDKLFPAEGKFLEPGIYLSAETTSQAKAGLKFSFGGPTNRRTYVLGWLTEMLHHPSEVSIEGDAFVRNGVSQRSVVSRTTGFVERIELTAQEEDVRVSLRECHLDEPLDPELVTLPAEAREAEEDQDSLHGFEQFAPALVRGAGFLRVEKQLASEKRTWNERTQTDWRAFLTALHEEKIELEYADWLAELQEYVDQLAARARLQWSEEDSPGHRAEIENQVAEERVHLVENFDQAEAEYTESLPPVEFQGMKPRPELFDMELAVIEKLYDELVREPVLASFDQKLDAAFEE